MTDAPSTNLPACPPWCKSPAGHPYEGETDGGVLLPYHEDATNLGEVAPVGRSMSFSGLKESPISATLNCEEQAVESGPARRARAQTGCEQDETAATAPQCSPLAGSPSELKTPS